MRLNRKSKSFTLRATTLSAVLCLACTSPTVEPMQEKQSKQVSRHLELLRSGIMGSGQLKFLDEYLQGNITAEFPFLIKRKNYFSSLEIEGWVHEDRSPSVVFLKDLEGDKSSFFVFVGRRVEKFTLILHRPLDKQKAGSLAAVIAKQIGTDSYGFDPVLDISGNKTNTFKRITWFRLKASPKNSI